MARRLGQDDIAIRPPARLEDLSLPTPRVTPPPSLAGICSVDLADRAGHAYGKSFRDIVRAHRGQLDHPPDVVAFPRDERDVVDLLDWCTGAGVAAIPYGGGSSVVGGVEPAVGPGYRGAVTIDLGRLDRVLEIDRTSRAARIQAGVLGPALEDQLRPHGLTLRHFPQSFEVSSLGGWLATRSGGHYATVYTHIDDLVESMRVVTPAGTSESFRLPGSGAGPSPDRLWLGSEGTLGIITEAWMRLQDRPRFKASAGVRVRRLPRRGGGGAGAVAVGALPDELPAARRRRGRHGRRCRRRAGAPGARLRVGRPPRRAVAGASDGAGGRPRGRGARGAAGAARRGEARGRLGGRVATVVPAGALHARCAGGHVAGARDLRDGDHLGPLPGAARRGDGDGAGRPPACLRIGHGDVPVHPRLPRRSRAVLLRDGARCARAAS